MSKLYASTTYTVLKKELEIEYNNIDELKKACDSIGAPDASRKCAEAMRSVEQAYEELAKEGNLSRILENNKSQSISEIVDIPTEMKK